MLDENLSADMAVGLLTGGLTSTPGLSAAKEVAKNQDAVVAGYGIAYTFGVLGVVLFVQLTPKLLKVNMKEEVANFHASSDLASAFLPFFLSASGLGASVFSDLVL